MGLYDKQPPPSPENDFCMRQREFDANIRAQIRAMRGCLSGKYYGVMPMSEPINPAERFFTDAQMHALKEMAKERIAIQEHQARRHARTRAMIMSTENERSLRGLFLGRLK